MMRGILYVKSLWIIVGRKKNSQNKWLKREWVKGPVGIGCGAAAATSAWEQRPVMHLGGHMVRFHPRRTPISAEFSADSRSQSRRNWHNVYYLEGSEIKTKTPHGAFEQISFESHRRVDRLLITTGGGDAFYRMVLREYCLWATRKKKNQISTRKHSHCLVREWSETLALHLYKV